MRPRSFSDAKKPSQVKQIAGITVPPPPPGVRSHTHKHSLGSTGSDSLSSLSQSPGETEPGWEAGLSLGNNHADAINETDQPTSAIYSVTLTEILPSAAEQSSATMRANEEEEEKKEEKKANDEGRKVAAKGVISGWLDSHIFSQQQQQQQHVKPDAHQRKEPQEPPESAPENTSDAHSFMPKQDLAVRKEGDEPAVSSMQPQEEERRDSPTIVVPSQGRAGMTYIVNL